MILGIEMVVIAVLSISFFYYLSWNEVENSDFLVKLRGVPGKSTRAKNIFMVVMTVIVLGVAVCRWFIYGTQDWLQEIELIVMLSFLIPMTWTDYWQHIIPNKLVYSGLILRVVFYVLEAVNDFTSFQFNIKSDVLGMVFILFISIIGGKIVKGGIGYGDVKLLGLMALYQGINGMLMAVLMSLVILFFVAIYFLLSKKKGKKDVLPFGPAAFAGTVLSMIFTTM